MLRKSQGASPRAWLINQILCLFLIFGFSSTAHAGHVATIQEQDTVYILYAGPNRLARFDLATGTALSDVVLSKVPTAMTVVGDLAYIGFNRELVAVDLDGGTSQFLRNFSSS